MATIALVMIVKNEERILRRAIDSVRSIVDEFVVVDTGSTDSTREIIAEYGPVHEIPFTNFVDTKNAALALAKSDYILLLDADEFVIAGLEFLKEHAENGSECVMAQISESRGRVVYSRARLWKNSGVWQFVGPGVHEVISGGENAVTDNRIVVEHNHEHRTGESYVERFTKYVDILKTHLESHPDDPRAMFYLGRTYKDLERSLESITCFRRYLSMNTPFRDERWQAAYDIAQVWFSEGEFDQSLEACDLADSIDPRRAEVTILRGRIAWELQDYETASGWYEKAAGMPVPDDVILFMNVAAHGETPLDYLVLCQDKLRQYRKARETTERLLALLGKPDERLVNNLIWLRKQENRKVFFALGHTPEPVYGGMIEQIGVGGVETTYLELPTELVRLGHTVFVFCRCERAHVYNGVNFVPYEDIQAYLDWKPDVVITSRWYDSLYMFPEAKKIAWMQDAHFADPNHPDVYQLIDALVCSSRWHRHYIAKRVSENLNAKKIHVIPLSIRKELFKREVERDPLKAIYSSNPNRGLFPLAEMWQEITEKVPGIHLAVTYGWEGLSTWSSDEAWLQRIRAEKESIERWAGSAGNVKLTGRLTKAVLAEELLSSSVCLYANNFFETFCLTALETQTAGVPMITTRLGALSTTLSNTGNVLIERSPEDPEYRKEFIDATVAFFNNEGMRGQMRQECLAFALEHPGWGEIAREWERIFWD